MHFPKSITTPLIFSLLSCSSFAGDFVYITTGQDLAQESLVHMKTARPMEVIREENEISLIKVDEDELDKISHIAHEEKKRCGGYIFHPTLEAAQSEISGTAEKAFAKEVIFADYNLDQDMLVKKLLPEVKESNLKETISKLSSYKNRYYQSSTGVDSQNWVYNKWKALGQGRSDFKVEKFSHSRWKQPSIIATIKGKSDEVIIMGGHGDSIAGYWGRVHAKAPGADDNASGIATLTEVLRILMESNYQPEKTIKFMSYAAEEVGLRGSNEIAKSFQNNGEKVIGVLQFDMTNFNGSKVDIVMMKDFTNQAQNAFIGTLIDKYLPGVSWGYDKCGYACSDHASWTSAGFPSSIPFEAKMREMNHALHTNRDTLERSNGATSHAKKFAKLGVAFAIELDR